MFSQNQYFIHQDVFKPSTFPVLEDFAVFGSAYQRQSVHEQDFRASAVAFLFLSKGSCFIWIFLCTNNCQVAWFLTPERSRTIFSPDKLKPLSPEPTSSDNSYVSFRPRAPLPQGNLIFHGFHLRCPVLKRTIFLLSPASHIRLSLLPPGSGVPPSWCLPFLLDVCSLPWLSYRLLTHIFMDFPAAFLFVLFLLLLNPWISQLISSLPHKELLIFISNLKFPSSHISLLKIFWVGKFYTYLQ